jgi:YD repeat-containing protein
MAYPPNPPLDRNSSTKSDLTPQSQARAEVVQPVQFIRLEDLVVNPASLPKPMPADLLTQLLPQLPGKSENLQYNWLPHIQFEQKDLPSLVPKTPANFAQEVVSSNGKIFLDARGRVVQVNRANDQLLAFTYAGENLVGVTTNRIASSTTDGTNWFYQNDGLRNRPDWTGKVEVGKDGTVTVTRPTDRDIYKIDGTQTFEKTDHSKIELNSFGKPTDIIAANGRHTSFDYTSTGIMSSMTDPRGKYTTLNGHQWYREKNNPEKPPDWKGTVQSSFDGTVTEKSDAGVSLTWNLDGTSNAHYKNGRHLDIDDRGNVIRAVDSNRQVTLFKYTASGQISEMSDLRGTFTTKDGNNWFQSGHESSAKPDWRGSVTVSASSGLITERNKDTGAVERWTLDGRRRTYEPTLPTTEFNTRAQKLFDQIDKNHNGYLSGTELGKALQDPQFTGRNAQVIAALYKCRDELKYLSNDEYFRETEVSKKDLIEFDKLSRMKNPGDVVEKVERYIYRTNNSQRDTLPCSLYSEDTDPLSCITPKAITQGTIGDCYLEAVIASIAASNPGKIRQMIEDNGDGSFTVTFPGDRAHPITVQAPTEAEMGMFGEAGKYGIWPNVLEKAFGEYYVERGYLPTKGYSATEGADGAGFASSSTKLLTGKKVNEYWCPGWRSSATNQEIKQALTDAFAEGRAVTCSIGTIEHGVTKDGYTKRHVYSIVGWDPNGKNGGTLTIRNPWGNPTEGPGGTSKMSYQQYLNNFNVITIEGK